MFGINPWALLIAGASALALLAGAYFYGRSDGAAHEALACETRVAKLQGEYDVQAKRIDELNKQWQATLDAFVEQEAERAKDRQAELDDANTKVDEYVSKLADSKKLCVLDDTDVGVMGLRGRAKR